MRVVTGDRTDATPRRGFYLQHMSRTKGAPMSTAPYLSVVNDAAPEPQSWVELDSLDEFLSEIGRYPLLTPAEEISLAKRIERGDPAARRRMIESNLRLVVTIAKDYRRGGVAFLDLIQDGMVGLIRAADGFDWRLGNRFSTYARWWIQQSICSGLAGAGRSVRLPVRLAARTRELERATTKLTAKLGRQPSESELCTALQLSPDQLQRARAAAASQVAVSLDAPTADEGRSLVEVLADESIADPADRLDTSPEATVGTAVSELPEQARRVLELHYGLDGGGERSYTEIANLLGVSVWRVREVEARALHLLRGSDDVRALRAA
jgi:RNA polymerase primary sigma factor